MVSPAKAVRPLRVGLNLLFLPPGRMGGTATYVWSLLERLQHRADLRFVVFSPDGYLDPAIDESLIDLVRCPSFDSTVKRVAWEHTVLPWRARRHDLDVVWSPGFVAPRFMRGARVVTVHDLHYIRVPAALPFLRRQYYSIGVPWSVKHCAAVLAVSSTTAVDLAREIPSSVDKTTVIHLAARSDLVALDESPFAANEPYFLMVASVTRNKNVDTVVRAAIALRDRGRDVRVRVVGADPHGILAEALEAPGALDAVAALGEVSPEELAALYQGAVATINPSIYEGFGLPVLEAQALGVPVISSRGGSLPEVAGDGALYFSHDSPAELGAAMESLLDEPARRVDLIELGAENVARFSWDRAADETAAVLIHVGRPG